MKCVPIPWESIHIFSYHHFTTFDTFVQFLFFKHELTLAGQDLLRTKIKVVDAAMRYQYDTSESFSKAFLRFHGISPSFVKKYADKLKCHRPFTINITIQRGFGVSRLILEDFDVPFSDFAGTSFINCFASACVCQGGK